ncbi:MAG: hypothetical protein IKT52_03330 [Oscillospiraceae bacterium]|nr:hypothetical protein [Oscillospiraceae bacterium]
MPQIYRIVILLPAGQIRMLAPEFAVAVIRQQGVSLHKGMDDMTTLPKMNIDFRENKRLQKEKAMV